MALCLGLSIPLLAFQQEGVVEGNKKVAIYGELSKQDKSSMLYVGSSIGYYINNYIELGGALYVFANEYDGDMSEAITIFPYAQYNFTDYSPIIIPYLGAGLTYSLYDQGGRIALEIYFD